MSPRANETTEKFRDDNTALFRERNDLKDKIKIGSYEEGQVMLGNQIAVLKGATNPNAAKLLVEFLLAP